MLNYIGRILSILTFAGWLAGQILPAVAYSMSSGDDYIVICSSYGTRVINTADEGSGKNDSKDEKKKNCPICMVNSTPVDQPVVASVAPVRGFGTGRIAAFGTGLPYVNPFSGVNNLRDPPFFS